MKLKIKSDFMPTWEEVEQGYCVYKVQGRYLGQDDYDQPRFANTRRYELIVKHNYSNLFEIYIQYDKKEENADFILKICRSIEKLFVYNEDGWNRLIDYIERTISQEINKLFEVVE